MSHLEPLISFVIPFYRESGAAVNFIEGLCSFCNQMR